MKVATGEVIDSHTHQLTSVFNFTQYNHGYECLPQLPSLPLYSLGSKCSQREAE